MNKGRASPAAGRAGVPRVLVTSPRPAADDPEAPLARRSPYARWRAATLILVYVLMVAHIVHWQLAGTTLAPLELHEVMYTAELGIVTAGFLFMALAVVATGIFGRFFCGWGCHLLALQDLSAWLLQKLRVRQKPIRARVIAWAPFAVMFYMFVWPHIGRIAAGQPHPGFRFADDSEPIASFTTTNFWRNLPDPWISGLTFLVCGGIAIYVLGSRGFCTYACPYGVLFGLVDRLAPGKVRVDHKCQQCGTCTKVCSSGIVVHDQLRVHGAVIDPRCLKDLDCVGACPHDALSYGFGKPSLLLRPAPGALAARLRYDFTLAEEWLMAVTFAATVFVFRGLYDAVPFLMSVGLGAITAYAVVVVRRLMRETEVALGKSLLKRGGRWQAAGLWFGGATALFLLLWAHSAVVHFAKWRGDCAYAEACAMPAAARGPVAVRALGWLAIADSWSLVPTAEAKAGFAWAKALTGDVHGATALLGEAVALAPGASHHRYYYAGFLARQGDGPGAITQLREAVRLDPGRAILHARLGELLREHGDVDAARAELELAARLDPASALVPDPR